MSDKKKDPERSAYKVTITECELSRSFAHHRWPRKKIMEIMKGMNKNKRSQEQPSNSQVYVKKEAKRSGWGSTPFLWRKPGGHGEPRHGIRN